MPGIEFRARMAGQWRELEFEEGMDVQRASLVVVVEGLIFGFMDFAVEDAFRDEKLRPFEVRVAGEQGVVEVKQG